MVELKREDSFGWQIAALARQMANELEQRLKQHGVKLTYWPTLFLLWQQEGLSQTELARECRTAHYTTTRVIDKLQSMKLVERRGDPASRRTHRIYLTKKGRALERQLTVLARDVNHWFLGCLGREEQRRLMSYINVVRLHAESEGVRGA